VRSDQIGEFEEFVLLAVAMLGENAYSVSVREALREHAGRAVTLGAVHAALYRLQDKGLLVSRLGGADGRRGGRRKRIFTVTGAGFKLVHARRAARDTMWSLIPG